MKRTSAEVPRFVSTDGLEQYRAIVSSSQFDGQRTEPGFLVKDVVGLVSRANNEIARLNGVIEGMKIAMGVRK